MWQAGAFVMVGPGLASDPATLEEVKSIYPEAEQVDEGLFLIPLTKEQEEKLTREGHLEFGVKLAKRRTNIPKPEMGEYVDFTLEMP